MGNMELKISVKSINKALIACKRFKCYRIDKIIIMAYAMMDEDEVQTHSPKVVFVDDHNKILRTTNYEKHGLLKDMD